jgi:hypothetical protein
MITTLDDFIEEYSKISKQGWIKTHRSGPTGVGKTLEDLLGIEENNIDGPDFGEYELKSCRIDSNSMLTMFTKAPQPAKANTYLREKYGYSSDAYGNDKKVLHATLTAANFRPIANVHQLKIVCYEDRISIASSDGVENVYWLRDTLKAAFDKKYKNKFVYAKAHNRGEKASEEFHYVEAYEMSGFDYEAMIELLEDGKIFVDLRIGQYANGKTHDHGTGFRIREIDQPSLFKIKRRIV